MDFFSTFIAGVFSKFKKTNPVAAGVTALVAGTVLYFADQGTALGLISLPTWAASATKWVSVLVLAVNSHQDAKD